MDLTEENLGEYRQNGDEPADRLMQTLFDKHGHKLGSLLMPFLSDFDTLNFSKQDIETVTFFQKFNILPDFYESKQTIRASDFFNEYQLSIGVVLGCYSLPYCYLGEDGARVLGFSGRIQNDTYNRLQETGKFVKNVMSLTKWENNTAISLILKVRLMHAFWRFMILKSGKWDLSWGIPINQEDMLGTNLSFSIIVLRGLSKFGLKVDSVYEKAYYHHWAVVGFLLGIHPDLLVLDVSKAQRADRLISKRQFRSSEIGQQLTASLSSSYQKITNSEFVSEYFSAQSRMFLGDKHADFLGIPVSKYSKELFKTINSTTSFLSNIFV